MSIATIHVPATLRTEMPRGAEVAATIARRVFDWLSPRRAGTALPSRGLTRAAEAAAVRRMAAELMASDPRFAADLYAAADRHQREE